MSKAEENIDALKIIRKSVKQSLLKNSRFGQDVPNRPGPRLAVKFKGNRLTAVTVKNFRATGKQSIITSVSEYELPSDAKKDIKSRTRFFGKQLRRLIIKNHAKDFVCIVDSEMIQSFIVDIPPLSFKDKVSALSLKALNLLGDYSYKWQVEATEIYPTTQGESNTSGGDYLLIAIKKSALEEYAEVFSEAHFIPSAIALPSELFQGLILSSSKTASVKDKSSISNEVWVIVDISDNITSVYFYNNNIFEYSRTIQFGGDMLTEALTTTVATPAGFVELTFNEAEELKKHVGIPEEKEDESLGYDTLLNGAQIRMMLEPKLKDFVFELRNSIRYYQQQSGRHRIQNLVFTGGTALLKGLEEYVEKNLKIRPHHFGPADLQLSLERLDEKEAIPLASSKGTLCAALQQRKIGLNLLPDNMRWERRLKRPCRIVTAAAVIITATLIALGASIKFSFAESYNTEPIIQKEILYKNQIESLVQDINQCDKKTKKIISGNGYNIPIKDLLEDISRKTPENVTLDRISIFNTRSKHKVLIDGKIVIESKHTQLPGAVLIDNYTKSPFIKSMRITFLAFNIINNNNEFSFKIEIYPYVLNPLDSL